MEDEKASDFVFKDMLPYIEEKGWGKDELSKLIDNAFCNIGKCFIDLKPYFEVLCKAYNILVDINKLLSYKDEAGLVIVSLSGRVLSCFVAGSRLALSGQLTETYILMRAIVENALYAYYVKEDIKRAEVWLKRHEDEKSIKACRTTFVIANIFNSIEKKSKRIKDKLYDCYNESIDWGAHPNERSVFPNLTHQQDRPGFKLNILNPHPDYMRVCLVRLFLCVSHVIDLYGLMFPEEIENPSLRTKIDIFKNRYKPLLANTLLNLQNKA